MDPQVSLPVAVAVEGGGADAGGAAGTAVLDGLAVNL